MNFQRAATIAVGRILIEPTPLPSGMAEILNITDRRFPEGLAPPYSYRRSDFDKLAALELDKAHPVVVQPNAIAVLHPLAYVPQVPVIALGVALRLPPLAIFYLGRLAGLAAGIVLTFFAIRIMPIHKHLLTAVALLPPMIFSRSTLDADQFNTGLAFLMIALVVREIVAASAVRPRTIAALGVGGFLLAQAKSAYLLLPTLAVAIPSGRIRLNKLQAFAFLILPGIVGSLIWLTILRSTFSIAAYRTWSGVVVPEQQLQLILADPAGFGGVLLKTVFGTAFLPKALLDFLGRFGPPVALPLAFFPLLAILLAGIGLSEGPQPSVPPFAKALALLIAGVTVCIILTLLYLQWTRVGAPVVDGFNGRYLYPLVPLFLVALPSGSMRAVKPGVLVAVLGAVGAAGTLFTTWQTYWI